MEKWLHNNIPLAVIQLDQEEVCPFLSTKSGADMVQYSQATAHQVIIHKMLSYLLTHWVYLCDHCDCLHPSGGNT